jgi:resuscitation-promoting factor RpfB
MLAAFKAWFVALSTTAKVGVVSGAVLTGGVASSAVNSMPPNQPVAQTTNAVSTESTCAPTTTIISEKEIVAFEKSTINDPYTDKGKMYVKVAGVNGEKTNTYEVTAYNPQGCKGEERKLLESEVTTPPVTEVTAAGSYDAPPPPPKPQSNCDPNYSGCVPVASDVDCGGGSGNGPAYLYGTVNVIGSDIYGLDRDSDGLACE